MKNLISLICLFWLITIAPPASATLMTEPESVTLQIDLEDPGCLFCPKSAMGILKNLQKENNWENHQKGIRKERLRDARETRATKKEAERNQKKLDNLNDKIKRIGDS